MPFAKMSRGLKLKAADLCGQLLQGVGERETLFVGDPPEVAIHLQKALTEAERRLLPIGWMEIPAVDDRGPVKRLWI